VTTLELAQINLTSPPVLAFAAGMSASLFTTSLRMPAKAYLVLSSFLLLAIGVKGGVALAHTSLAQLWLPLVLTLALGLITPLVAYAILTKVGKLSVVDSAAIAAHYGSVSAVTFTASMAFLTSMAVPFEGFMPTLVAVLEIPAIAVALLIARMRSGDERNLGGAMREIFTGRSIVLLVAGLGIGFSLSATQVVPRLPNSFMQVFFIALTIFLLEMGATAARRLRDLRTVGWFLVAFAITVPIVFGLVGVLAGSIAGLSLGGATILGVMAASASYIAAPAAVRAALPEANPAYYLTASLGITFPFNLAIGIPLYYGFAKMVMA
jgi:uncharacterized protein